MTSGPAGAVRGTPTTGRRAWSATSCPASAGWQSAVWAEIGLAARLWTIPAERMKMQRPLRVPLCARAAQVLEVAHTLGDGEGLVFPTARGARIDDMALSKLLRDLGIGGVPHGFRSSFRDWAAKRTDHPREVVEAALAHVVPNKVEAAYARSDLLERRRPLMDDWAEYLETGVAGMDQRRQ